MILLDTCVFLWLAADQAKLSANSRQSLRLNAGRLFVSSISAFEIAVKAKKGKLNLPVNPEDWFSRALRHHGIREIPVNSRIAVQSIALPPLHNDPCDRIIIATALEHTMPVVTSDRLIKQYPGITATW